MEEVKKSAFLVEVLSAICIAYLTSLTGFVYAWPSYTVANFASNETVLSRPMSTLELSLLGSLTNIGALAVTPFCGHALDTLGRKYAAMMFGLPFVVAWAVIAFSSNIPLVIIAIGFAGVGCAGQAVSSVYISEICQDSIRGALTSTTVSGFFLGLLFSYAIGGHLTYHQVVYVHLTLSILYMALLAVLKESPVFLIQRGREEEAAKSIAFYRRVDVTSKEVEVEIMKIKLQLDPRIEAILQSDNDPKATEELLTKSNNEEVKAESAWKFLIKSESSKRALATAITVMALSILMGCLVLQVYAEPLFKEAVPSMNSNQCSIFLALDFLVASFLSALMMDRLGRKFLMTTTSIASGILTLLLGTQLHYRWAPHWVTAVFIYSYCFVYNMGAAVVPFVLTAELFLPEVRGLCNSMSMACMWIVNFVVLIVFNPLVDSFGLGTIFCGFSVVCFCGAAYSQFCLPETKGLSADAIQLLFLKKRPNIARSNVLSIET
ncbi:hypothetical protein ABMA27_009198 [Loxostege sticticalis]|uniref:Major facilitator superfamily (MFS) profile domain-containing protein n=1 Tax=Loxostege sticticalis TaxID=481309 RepID=A0ABR3HA98_LOXSC